MDVEKLKEALDAYQAYNHIRNDLDSYLFELGEWALEVSGSVKPKREDYGLISYPQLTSPTNKEEP